MMRMKALAAILLFWPAGSYANCDRLNADQVKEVFAKSIELNERFKESIGSVEHNDYQTLRKQNEQYGEETAIPCLYRAEKLLDKYKNRALLLQLLAYIVSHTNSADETASEVIATVFAKHPARVVNGLTSLKPDDRSAVLERIDVGLLNIELKPAQRKRLTAKLKTLQTKER